MTQIDDDVPMPDDIPTLKQSRKRETTHLTKAQDTWDNYDIHEEADKPWVRGTSLEAPPARPGFAQRWIRVAMHGQADPTNAMRRMREGWKPRPSDSLPPNHPLPTVSHGEWAGCIGVEGSVLMEMPLALVDKRNAYYQNKTESITNSIETELQNQSTSQMPISQERKSSVGREVKVADD